MTFKRILGTFIIGYGLIANLFAATNTNPCGDPPLLLNVLDRPTNAYSPCLVPFKKALIEWGSQFQRLRYSGHLVDLPEAALRVGLPANNEFMVSFPNYFHQSSPSYSGFGATTLGFRHQLNATQKWVAAIQGLLTLPDGSAAYGSKGFGGIINGIIYYTITPRWGLTFVLGGSTQTTQRLLGGRRYTSINPDLVLTYVVNNKMNIFGEIYGQSKTGPGQRGGVNFDAGILYLLLPNFSVDLEVGQQISGNLYGFQNYIGAGMAVMF